MDALDWYSRQWRQRRNIIWWIEATVVEIGPNSEESSIVKAQDLVEHETMSDYEEWKEQEEMPTELPDVIPETFLWNVFDQLVDAFTILGTGGDDNAMGGRWKEIVHSDVHLQNVFVKKHENAVGTPLPANPEDGSDRFIRYEIEEV
jgi:hypothetical protein